MPPKQKVAKEDILNAALTLTRQNGFDAVNARAIAALLHCSTQPVFSNYASMEALKSDVLAYAYELYHKRTNDAMSQGRYPPYKASGMAYIQFARDERELFQLLFMCRRSRKESEAADAFWDEIVQLVSSSTRLDTQSASRLHLEMWIFVHGIAAMIATSYLEFDEELISSMLSDAYLGLKARYLAAAPDH